jgi:hypothetical protein
MTNYNWLVALVNFQQKLLKMMMQAFQVFAAMGRHIIVER